MRAEQIPHVERISIDFLCCESQQRIVVWSSTSSRCLDPGLEAHEEGFSAFLLVYISFAHIIFVRDQVEQSLLLRDLEPWFRVEILRWPFALDLSC